MAKISVLGAGSWGTALSVLLCDNGHEVILWSRKKEEADELREKREHVSKLPGVKLPDSMRFTSELEEALPGRDLLVMAVPSIAARGLARRISCGLPEGQLIVNVAKGIEEETLLTLSEQIEEEIPQADVAVLSGPSHAEEVGRKLPTT